MRNKKIMIIFITFVTITMIFMLNSHVVKGFDDTDFIIDENTEENTDKNEVINNNETNKVQNNTEVTNNNLSDNQATNKLPQTGITEGTTLFIFIAICIVSAVYAYIKIKNYKNI